MLARHLTLLSITIVIGCASMEPPAPPVPAELTQDITVRNRQGLAQLRGLPMQIGDYEVLNADSGWTYSAGGFTVGLGGSPTTVERINSRSRRPFTFELGTQGTSLARIECMERHRAKGWAINQTHGSDTTDQTAIIESRASRMLCTARPFHPNFPSWSLELIARDGGNTAGVLQSGVLSYAITASEPRPATIGMPPAHLVHLNGRPVYAIDPINQGRVWSAPDLEISQRMALSALAAVLLQAREADE